MSKRLLPGQRYAGRRPDVAVINVSLDQQAAELIRTYSGGKKMGAFVSRLVFEYHAKEQERLRMQHAIHSVLEETTRGAEEES